eukprot:TRINITY_DN23545_c0_g1_i2.p1 TRINITY_DN23545_c0_g1~~TRINITY_DN23545_c0_g1_i2.p1  ORF type:complete len:102 (-),score=22.42 TRINITY_DN23545_c0_g1_i2:56-361(-)
MCIRDSMLHHLPLARHHSLVCSAGSKGYCAVKEMLQNGNPGHTLLIESDDLHNTKTVSYTHLRAHETPEHLVCRLLLEKKKHINKEDGRRSGLNMKIEDIL